MPLLLPKYRFGRGIAAPLPTNALETRAQGQIFPPPKICPCAQKNHNNSQDFRKKKTKCLLLLQIKLDYQSQREELVPAVY